MKKILFVLSYSHLGGAETRAVDLAVNLKESCVPVFIIYGSKNGAVQKIIGEQNINFIERPKFNWNHPNGIFFLLFSLFQEVFFLVKTAVKIRPYSMMSFCADANILLFCANVILRNPRTYWCQEDDFIQWRWKRLFLKSIQNSKNVVSVSDFITEQTLSKTGRSKEKIITISNAINPTGLEVSKINSNNIRISVVGHINRIKNQGYVIKAVQEIIEREQITNLELNLYGNISDSEYWDEIKVKAPWLIHYGYKSKNFIYNNTDILIIPSLSEASPLVIQEGDFFNLTIFCSDTPVFRSNRTQNILLFDLANSESLISQLMPILNKSLVVDLNKKNREIYDHKYSQYLNSYLEILLK